MIHKRLNEKEDERHTLGARLALFKIGNNPSKKVAHESFLVGK